MGWDGGSSPGHGCSRLAGVCQDLLHAGAWIAPGDVQRDPVFLTKLSLVTELCLGPRISHTTRCRCFRLPRRAHGVGLSQPVSISGTSVSLVPCHQRDGRTTGPQNWPYNPSQCKLWDQPVGDAPGTSALAPLCARQSPNASPGCSGRGLSSAGDEKLHSKFKSHGT